VALVERNTRDLLNDPKIREPWPEFFVEWNAPRDLTILDELAQVLNAAQNEKPLQEFYAKHPYLLAIAFRPHCCWVFPKARLGGQHIPDFLYCDKNSLGFEFTLVELESPTMEATNKDESVSHDCHHAVEQILDYRRWLTDNGLAEQKQFPGIDNRCKGYVVIGRREGRTELEEKRLANFRDQHIEIASYDRSLYEARDHLQAINHRWKDSAERAEKAKAIRDKASL
jgi:Domain of unknown function (DUF4263)